MCSSCVCALDAESFLNPEDPYTKRLSPQRRLYEVMGVLRVRRYWIIVDIGSLGIRDPATLSLHFWAKCFHLHLHVLLHGVPICLSHQRMKQFSYLSELALRTSKMYSITPFVWVSLFMILSSLLFVTAGYHLQCINIFLFNLSI